MLTEMIAFRASREEKAKFIKRAKDNNTSVGNLIRGVMNENKNSYTDKKIDDLRDHLYGEFDNVIEIIKNKKFN